MPLKDGILWGAYIIIYIYKVIRDMFMPLTA